MGEVSKDEATKLCSKLKKETLDPETAKDILEKLKSSEISLKVMIDSQIGMAVKALRSNKNEDVQKLAADLTRQWKDQVKNSREAAPKSGDGSSTPTGKPKTPKRTDSSASMDSDRGKEEKKKEEKKKEEKKKDPPAPIKSSSSGGGGGGPLDEKRKRAKDVLVKALSEAGSAADSLGGDIEAALFKHFKATSAEYTNMVKSLKFNLTDPKNPDFRSRVINAEISPGTIPTLSSSQMAGKEKIMQKQANWESATFQDQMFITAQNLGAESDMFPCPKCKQRKCTFYQKQTRSADEPMTVFLTCKACGHEWRDGG